VSQEFIVTFPLLELPVAIRAGSVDIVGE